MKTALRLEAEITEDGRLVVDLPPELPTGRVAVTLELLPADDLALSDEDLTGAGLTAAEIATSPGIGAWAEQGNVETGAEYVDHLRQASPRYRW